MPPIDYATYYRQRQLYAPQESQDDISLPPRQDIRFPALEEYATQVSQTPKREQYRPKFWDRLTAGMAGFSEGGLRGGSAGVSSAMNVLNTPYQRALEDYNTRLGGYKGAADVEGDIFNRGQSIESQRLREILGMLNAQVQGRRAGAAESQANSAAARVPLYERDVQTRERRGGAYDQFTTGIYPEIQRERLSQQETDSARRARLYADRTAMMGRSASLRASQPKVRKENFPKVNEQKEVKRLALKEIQANNPQLYSEFVKDDGKTISIKSPTKVVDWRFDLSDAELAKKQERFEQFQSLLDSLQVQMLQRSGLSSSGYPAIEGDELTSEDEEGVLEEDEEE